MKSKTEEFITVKIWLKTRRKLCQIAALTDKNMVEVVELMVARELERLQKQNK